MLSGKIEKRLLPASSPTTCAPNARDDRKDKPKLGLEVIRGAKKSPDAEVWEGGKILDPENGKSYTLKMTPIEGGKKMEVRGSFGPFGRTQTWTVYNEPPPLRAPRGGEFPWAPAWGQGGKRRAGAGRRFY